MGLPVAPKKTGAPPRTMQDTKYCSSCKNTKPAGDFIHPRTGKDKKTCAECIMKRSAAAKRKAPVDTTATLQLHTTRLDDHEQRIACVEETLYDYDAAGAPPAPDAPGAGDGTFTKSQLRRQKRKNKMAARAAARALDFVLVGDDAASDSTDLDSLASTHSCVRALVEENRQLSAGLRGMRLLLRDPSARLVQRVGRGLVGRSRAKSRLAAVEKIQAMVRRRAKCNFVAATTIQASCARGPPCITLRRKCLRAFTKLQGRERIRMARRVCRHKRLIKASIVIAAAWRRYHILSTTLFGKLLSRTRAAMRLEKELTIVKKEKDEAQTKLTEANELLAANERELRNAVHATLCANPPEVTVVKGASPFMKALSKLSLSKFLHELMGCKNHDISKLPSIAQLITKGLMVEVKGDEEGAFGWSSEALKNGDDKKSWSAKIIQVKDGGKYEVEFDNVHAGTKGEAGYIPNFRKTLRATQFRIL